ncbi:hypothetical protein [Microbacterium paludicola]|uniref:hypothetical protein n=1 Tax=Microbacterium paludicola TaxID=300019 RepID=UPI0031D90E5A
MTDDGRTRLAEVSRMLEVYQTDPGAAADDDLRTLRKSARAAIDRLDDEPEFHRAHETLDAVGNFVRQVRPDLCLLTPDGEGYLQECPVDLGHLRVGFSVGVEILESHCSICEQDPWECPHIPGESYGGRHATRVVTRANFFEASLVKRPDFPDARIMSRPISRADVEETLGAPLPAGAQLVCDRCLMPCAGI